MNSGPRISQDDEVSFNLKDSNYKVDMGRTGIEGSLLKGTVVTTVSANPILKSGKTTAKQGVYYRPAASQTGSGSTKEVLITFRGEDEEAVLLTTTLGSVATIIAALIAF